MIDRVVIINDDSVERGGAASIALTSVRLLRQRGVPVTVVCGDEGENPELTALGVEFVALCGTHILERSRAGAFLEGIYNRSAKRLLSDWIGRNDTPGTIYHLHTWTKILSPSIFRVLRSVQDRLLISSHDFFLVCPNGGYFNFRDHSACTLAPMGLSCALASCDRRHYAHKLWRVARQGVRQLLLDLGHTRATILVVHEGMIPFLKSGGVSGSALKVLRNPILPWRTQRVMAERNSEVFYVGRLEADKGVDLLARAARQARVRLRVVGVGPMSEMLARDFPEVELLGWRSREELELLIASARMLVMPTRTRESFGLVALEALTSGVPVIASTNALIAEELERLGLGIACDPHDEAGLTAAIRALADDDQRVDIMSRRAYDQARLLAPTPDSWCEHLLMHYAEKLEGSNENLQPALTMLASPGLPAASL